MNMKNTATTETFDIPSSNFAKLEAELKRLRKKGLKLKLGTVIEWTRGASFEREIERVYPSNGRTYKVTVTYIPVTVTVHGDVVLPGGWHLVAALDHRSAETPIIRAVPGEELPHEFRERGPDCDHCETKRKRYDTFVIRNDEGDYKTVGRTCIADYLGHKDALTIADFYSSLGAIFRGGDGEEDEWLEERYGRPDAHWELVSCIAFVGAIIHEHGWSPRSLRDGNATADVAWGWFQRGFQPETFTNSYGVKVTVAPPDITEREEELAAKALAWLEGQEAKSDYIYNCKAIASAGYVTQRTIGIAASIAASYKKAVERDLEYKRRNEARGDSEHVGELKERLRGLKITVLGTFETEGDYGLTTRVKFTDENDNDFIWWASGDTELEPGKSYVVDATVKRHGEYKGRKVTTVNRVTIKKGVE